MMVETTGDDLDGGLAAATNFYLHDCNLQQICVPRTGAANQCCTVQCSQSSLSPSDRWFSQVYFQRATWDYSVAIYHCLLTALRADGGTVLRSIRMTDR